MTRVFYASTLFGAMSLAAALDAGRFGERGERRLLLTSNNTAVPEIVDSFHVSPAFDALRSRFDDLIHWNDVIAPLHPSDWMPLDADLPMLQKLFALRLGLDDDPATELVLESIAVSPARVLGMLIPDCPVTVYSDGLMSYGPTRDEVNLFVGARIERLLHLDMLPGLTPLLLREYDVPAELIPDDAFAKVLTELPAPSGQDVAGWPVLVGQYLSALGILTVAQEVALYGDLLRGLVGRGHRRVVFAPHPGAGETHVRPMQEIAAELGVTLVIAGGGLPVECWFAAYRPELVVSCFSTALITARHWFTIPTACAGTEVVLERLDPYQNSNRIPATLVDATTARLGADGALVDPPTVDLNQLLRAVGYCMQPTRHPDLRADGVRWIETHGRQRYFKNRRLESLGLIDAPPQRSPAARRAAAFAVRSGMASARSLTAVAGRRRGRQG